MTIETTLEKYIITELFHDRKSKIDVSESLISTGLLDSLTLLQLIAFIEENYGISVDDSEMTPENFQTITDMKAFIMSKM